MRGLLRGLVVVSLLLGGTAVAPVASADDGSAPPGTSVETGTDPGTDPGAGTDPGRPGADPGADTGTDTGTDAGTASELAAPPVTTITTRPPTSTTSRDATLSFSANQPGATFECRLTGPGHLADTFAPCATGAVTDDTAGTTTGTQGYTGLLPGDFVFAVRATTAGGTEDPAVTASWTVSADRADDDDPQAPGAEHDRSHGHLHSSPPTRAASRSSAG